MSVFSDFQRMWRQRFPDNSLSSEWEEDVRSSLQRHKQKIIDLQKELEQETLYVEYLDRLLEDVGKFRDAGGDPLELINITASAKSIDSDNKNDDIDNRTSTADDNVESPTSEEVCVNQSWSVCARIAHTPDKVQQRLIEFN